MSGTLDLQALNLQCQVLRDIVNPALNEDEIKVKAYNLGYVPAKPLTIYEWNELTKKIVGDLEEKIDEYLKCSEASTICKDVKKIFSARSNFTPYIHQILTPQMEKIFKKSIENVTSPTAVVWTWLATWVPTPKLFNS